MNPLVKKDDIDFMRKALACFERPGDDHDKVSKALDAVHGKMKPDDSVLIPPDWTPLLIDALQNNAIRHVGCQVPDGVEVIKRCAILIATLKYLREWVAERVREGQEENLEGDTK